LDSVQFLDNIHHTTRIVEGLIDSADLESVEEVVRTAAAAGAPLITAGTNATVGSGVKLPNLSRELEPLFNYSVANKVETLRIPTFGVGSGTHNETAFSTTPLTSRTDAEVR